MASESVGLMKISGTWNASGMDETSKTKFINGCARGLLLLSLSIFAYGCISDNDPSDSRSVSLSLAVTGAMILTQDQSIEAELTIDENKSRVTTLTADLINDVMVGEIGNLSPGRHVFDIDYYINDSKYGRVKIASARTEKNLSSGSNTIQFTELDYSYDDDEDGISNYEELSRGMDPRQAITFQAEEISIGAVHFCAIGAAGEPGANLVCWGYNDSGQLGGGTVGPDYTYAVVSNGQLDPGTWVDVATGGQHSCAIDSHGRLWCWGSNVLGQIGDGNGGPLATAKSSPVQVLSQSGALWKSVSAGSRHTCAIDSNEELWCWGDNESGQIGNGTTQLQLSPVRIAHALDKGWKSVSTISSHTCAIDIDLKLWCWGGNTYGQTGSSTTVGSNTTSPSPVIHPGGSPWDRVETGYRHTCAIDLAGDVWCFGDSEFGQAGGIEEDEPIQLVRVAHPEQKVWIDIVVGAFHSCAIDDDDALWCWGDNRSGQIGDNETMVLTPKQLGDSQHGWVRAAAGSNVTCGIRSGGSIWCWPGIGDVNKPSRVRLGGKAALVSTGMDHTCALKDDGTLWCWGASRMPGEKKVLDPTPMQIPGSWKDVSVGGGHTCAVASDTALWCWGLDAFGQIGDRKINNAAGLSLVSGKWESVSSGDSHTCAVDTNSGLWCWGSNEFGQLGSGDQLSSDHPRNIDNPAGAGWVDVSAGYLHTCAVDDAGDIWCWGLNSDGQLGDGTFISRSAPVRVAPPEGKWRFVTAGYQYTCGIDDQNSLYCWGWSGVVGSNTPSWIIGSWLSASIGVGHTCATLMNGDLWCGGLNRNGQVGNGTFVDTTVPVDLGGTWAGLSAGYFYTCGISTNGTLWCWGANHRGQLGIDTAVMDLAPIHTKFVN
jgi:alpha-tubulin suppressor-like RCC1 family protein